MKARLLFCVSLSLLAVAAMCTGAVAQAQTAQHTTYTVKDLGTLGGTYSFAYSINNSGVVAGGAATASQTDFVSQTAFVWDGGSPINLGTLGGPSCHDCSSEGAAASLSGAVALLSETASTDVNGEDFCGFGTHHQCLAAVWKNGALDALPTLPAGHNSQAYWSNNQGGVIGFSETGTPDPTCLMPFQVRRFEAVKWGASGQPTPLRPLQGDTVSFAFGMNDNGEAVGVSGLCSNTMFPPNYHPMGPHAVLWQADGTPTDLGGLAGAAGNNVASSVNNQGDVVGTSLLTDGTTHAFLWTRTTGRSQDLGTFPAGSVVTVAPCCHAINDSGEIAGFSVDALGNLRALVWRGNVPTDLNTLIPADSPWYLLQALSINDIGEIVGVAGNITTFEVHAFLASPITGIGPAARGATKPPALPKSVQTLLQRRRHF